MTTAEATVDNAVNLEALLGARVLLGDKPEMGQFTWKAASTSVAG